MNKINYAYVSDKYQYTMGKSYLDCGKQDQIAVFNLFYRKAPENNNWAVVSGTEEVIEMVKTLGTEPEDFYEKFLPGEEYKEFRKYLSTMKFTGDVYTMREGEIVFPNQPMVAEPAPAKAPAPTPAPAPAAPAQDSDSTTAAAPVVTAPPAAAASDDFSDLD